MASEDWISRVPDDILFHIISSLPFESAIQTIFLSKRWRLLWEKVIVKQETEVDVDSAICDFLANFNDQDPSKNTRKFQFHFINGSILLAIIAPNNKLHLDFSTGKQEFHKQFRLQIEFDNPPNHTIHPSPSPSTFFVKSLHLISVSHLTAEAVSSILTNFQVLENLKIAGCDGLESLSIGSDTKLLSLTIFDCLQLQFLYIRSFKLRTFRIRGLLPSFSLKYHYNLVDAFLDFRQGPRSACCFTSCDLDLVLLTIKNVEVLTLCKWIFQALICPWLSTFLAEFQFYNLKELWWIDKISDQTHGNDALVSFLKLCPSLERLFVTVDPKSYFVERTNKCSIQAGRNTQLQHLKLVKLDGFINREDEILLVGCLEEVVPGDPLILSSVDGLCLRRLTDFPLQQPKQKGSTDRNCSYKYVEEKDIKQLCPKHVHMAL